MPRPQKFRKVGFIPEIVYYKPAGIPMRDLDEIVLTVDELEALRLVDMEGLYQEDASARMGVSRQTIANILASARSKVTECLVHGRALRIEGGKIETLEGEHVCRRCRRKRSFCRKDNQEEAV